MKRLNYILAFVVGFIPFFLSDAQAENLYGNTNKQEVGDFIVAIKDFHFVPGADQSKLECQPTSIEFKPEKGEQSHDLSTDQFCKLWDAGSSFNKQPPNATLAFHQNGALYQMIFKIPEVTEVSAVTTATNASEILIQAVTYDPHAAYTKNGKAITKDEFISATKESGKENISLLIDNDPWDPRH